ncbi:VRR-NUC domain-containing protein [Enterobacter sp. BRE11]|nr:VRR-NUC domain-containing protein [Enterobacter sp. BRE11]
MRVSEEWYHSYSQKKKTRSQSGKQVAPEKPGRAGKALDWLAPVKALSAHAIALAALAKKPEKRKGKQEHYDQVQIFDHFHRSDSHIYEHLYAIPNGGFRLKATAAAIEAEGAKRGYPDMGLEIPAGVYHGMRIEQKHGKRMPAEKQVEWMRRLAAQGFYVLLSFSPDETIRVIKQYVALRPGEGMPAHENDEFWSE